MLTGKTIGELTLLETLTSNTLFPVELSGVTYHAAYSAFTSNGGGVIEVTYSELVDGITGATLTPGTFYTITDYRTCYDQPDFDIDNNPITNGTYKESAVEPIMVFATSANTISTFAYQPSYPNDKIQYDWTFSATEVTQGVAYGRITERIDEFNNRTDYDHRTIEFKRYRLYTYRNDQPLNGTIELLSNGTVSGVNTSFSSLTVGNVVYIPATNLYYEIVSITGNTNMTVSGDTIGTAGAGSAFYLAVEETNDSDGYFNYKKTNVKTDDFIEYTTFGDAIASDYAKNNYVGNFANNYTNTSSGTFILANNVFLEGQYESNKFGDYCYNNTFGTDNQNNTWGDYCYENASTNDIDNCIIGNYFYGNIINANLDSTQIGDNFHSNKLFTENSTDFADNRIGNYFNNNTIYSGFYDNIIDNNFQDNIIGDFVSLDTFNFYRNSIQSYFASNTVRQEFYKNEIGFGFNNNQISGDTSSNRIGEQFQNNTIYDDFYDNQIFNEFKGNMIYGTFYLNKTDWAFASNEITGSCFSNTFGPYINSNNFLGEVSENVIKGNFNTNTMGDYFKNNTIGYDFYDNFIGIWFYSNTIGNEFYNNTIGDNFGYGNSDPQGNKIGNNFRYNTVGEYAYNNSIPDNFENNTIGDYFQWNIVNTVINNTDFTTNYGNITGVTYVANGTTGTDAVYTDLSGTTNGIGTGATFDVEVSGGAVIGVSGFSDGRLYQTGNTITILGTQISGATPADDVVITVTGISVNPSVYETYTCQIFERQGGNKRLSYYDSSDTLTIKNINE
jgi:hypothetical protein